MALLNAERDITDGTTPTHPRHQQPPRKPSRPRLTYQHTQLRTPGQRPVRTQDVCSLYV